MWMSHLNGKQPKHAFGVSTDIRRLYGLHDEVLLDSSCACFVLFEQNEVPEVKKEETLLDLDFDPFKPEVASAGTAGVSHSPMSQVSSVFYDVWR